MSVSKLLSQTQFAVFVLCVTSLFAQTPDPKEPEELVRLRKAFNQKREDVLKPVDASYRQQLEMLIRSLTSRNQIDAAVLVRKELALLPASSAAGASLKKALLESKWSWAVGKDEYDPSVQMIFLEDGTVSHSGMHGTWKITGPREVTLVQDGGQVRVFQFDESLQSYKQTNQPDPAHGQRLP